MKTLYQSDTIQNSERKNIEACHIEKIGIKYAKMLKQLSWGLPGGPVVRINTTQGCGLDPWMGN